MQDLQAGMLTSKEGAEVTVVLSDGGGKALYNMQPTLVLGYIICVQGICPSRP